MAFTISPSPRVRTSPYYSSTVGEGVQSFTVYNHMLMPTSYGDREAEYWRLINGVSMWDVAVERQVELRGPDAARLAQTLVPRIIADQPVGMGWYVPVCDHRGVLVNDPILLKLDEDHFWFSIADSDMELWTKAIAGDRQLNVAVSEPDVSPLAIQGPMAENVTASLFGDSIRDVKHFEVVERTLQGIPLRVARSGWSKQGGFELYLLDGNRGVDLWNLVKEAGQPWDIGPGTPNPAERIESGLLSWGGDTDDETNPFEVRMGRFVDIDAPDEAIGIQALRRIKAEGPRRHQLGIKIETDDLLGYFDRKGEVHADGQMLGHLTATTYSPRLQQNIGLCLVSRALKPGDAVELAMPDGSNAAGTLCKLPFL